MAKKVFIETERKWLLKNLPNLAPAKAVNIIQYFTEGDYRYRRESHTDIKGEFIYKMKKTSIGEGKSEEVVEEISLKEFWEATKDCPYIVKKKRYVYPLGNHNIEIDVFRDMCLMLMEIEVNDLEEELQIPESIQKYIIKEVTGDPHFSNKYLSGFVN